MVTISWIDSSRDFRKGGRLGSLCVEDVFQVLGGDLCICGDSSISWYLVTLGFVGT